ncbi:LamG-like jellyroll fold domain-containing protein [Galbibacter mesophilus]|uniref:LamG-like jellyroll fold domain-containing protein n=1 Tax=Galbibacter mesophilus TaxID=379069 RepID=UPI00191DDC9F|nr:LamG-like jellyroll fold domain-containing protein [Galbibacter mesophilus]MCM5661806.1 T9SS type A sorting domain-containing protein [Galbibacter mesophilus]
MNFFSKTAFCLFAFGLLFNTIKAQEIGANFNHDFNALNFDYLQRSQVDWIRTTPYITDYIFKGRSVQNSDQFTTVNDLKNSGYKIAFGFRWDFKALNMRIPEPNSEAEQKCFAVADSILDIVGPSVDLFKLGNEPQLETFDEDMVPNNDGVIPLVRFFKRLNNLVIKPYFETNRPNNEPPVYVGSLVNLQFQNAQNLPAVVELMNYVQTSDDIDGAAIHLHARSLDDVETAIKYARSVITEKPFMVPEFSLQGLFRSTLEETLGNSPEGIAFAQKYGRDPSLKLYEYYTIMNTNKWTPVELQEYFDTRDWFPHNFLMTYYYLFKQYGVTLATYPLSQQSAPQTVTPENTIWFFNPIYGQKLIELKPNGDWNENPIAFDDFMSILNGGYMNDPVKLLFHFDFDDRLKDSSSEGYSLVGNKAPVYTNGRYGKSISFDDTPTYFDLNVKKILNTGTEPFTLATWVRNTSDANDISHLLHQFGGRVLLTNKKQGANYEVGTWIGGAEHTLSGNTLAAGSWQHVAITFNPETKTHQYYLNGELKGETVSENIFENEIGGFRIGASVWGNVDNPFTGEIDEMYLYRGILSSNQIANLMDDEAYLVGQAGAINLINEQLNKKLQATASVDGTPGPGAGNNVRGVNNTINNASTRWRLVPNDQEYFRIESVSQDLWLQCTDQVDFTDGQPNAISDTPTWAIRAASKENTGDWTLWRKVDAGNGYFRLENKGSGKWLQITSLDDVDDGNSDGGVQVRAVNNDKTGAWTLWREEDIANQTFFASMESEVQDEQLFTIYPNPTTSVIHIDEVEANTNIAVYSFSGTKLEEHIGKETINIGHLQKGIYFLKVNDQTIKILKQ